MRTFNHDSTMQKQIILEQYQKDMKIGPFESLDKNYGHRINFLKDFSCKINLTRLKHIRIQVKSNLFVPVVLRT